MTQLNYPARLSRLRNPWKQRGGPNLLHLIVRRYGSNPTGTRHLIQYAVQPVL